MLPILRILPVGGVLLAIFILVLALIPPDGPRSSLSSSGPPARGALVDREKHPEVRQFLILAAVKRANELDRLRDLPDTPARPEPPPEPPKVAALPTERSDAEPEENTVTPETPDVTVPIEIGEPPSTDVPAASQEEAPPEVKKAEPGKAQREIRRRTVHRARHKAVANATQQFPPTIFDILFGGEQYRQTPYAAQQTAQSPFTHIYPVPKSAY